MQHKHKRKRVKKIVVLMLTAILMVASISIVNVSAVSSSKSVGLQNGYTHKLTFSFGSTSGSSTISITNGGPCSLKNDITAIEYQSNGVFVRNLHSYTTIISTTSRTCSVSRQAGTSNYLVNYISIGTNYTSSAADYVPGNSYFYATQIGDNFIRTAALDP